MTSDELDSATISLPCRTHGQVDPDADGAARVRLPSDAVFLREKPLAGTTTTMPCVLAVCDGHAINRPVTSTEHAALRAAGAVRIDEPTALLLLIQFFANAVEELATCSST